MSNSSVYLDSNRVNRSRSVAILFVVFQVLITGNLSAQESDARKGRNGIYVEAYAIRHDFSDGFASLNYERYIGTKKVRALRAGIYPDFESTVSIPLTITRITWPDRNYHLEYGLGLVLRGEIFEGNFYRDVPALMFPLMYRYQKAEGLFFRAGINLWVSWPIFPSPSFSVGYRF